MPLGLSDAVAKSGNELVRRKFGYVFFLVNVAVSLVMISSMLHPPTHRSQYIS